MSVDKKALFLDIETDFSGKLLNIGWCTEKLDDKGVEHWIFQRRESLYYPEDADKKYVSILTPWQNAVDNFKTTSVKKVLEDLLKASEGRVVSGWNCRDFDIKHLRRYFEKYLGIDWRPRFFDGYLWMKKAEKERKQLSRQLFKVNGATPSGKLPSMTAESMFHYYTGCHLVEELHQALPDAQQERILIRNMCSRQKISMYELSEVYMTTEERNALKKQKVA